MTFTVLQGDARHLPLADGSVHCCVTSPPYWNLRDYGVPGQLGLEPTPDAYVANMVAVFREVWRVLRADGTVWLNMGDSYAGGGGYYPDAPSNRNGSVQAAGNRSGQRNIKGQARGIPGLKPKDLIGIPWRVALALQAEGWWLRSDIVWAKGLSFCESYAGSCMPESVTDRPTSAHEHVFLLAKSRRYFYDNEAVKEPCAVDVGNAQIRFGGSKYGDSNDPHHATKSGNAYQQSGTRNLRNVWAINPEGFPGSHFAVMPTALAEPCIKAGTSERGCCPTCGAPWRRVVERGLVNTEGWGAARKDHTGNLQGSNAILRNGNGRAGDSVSHTLGWQPTCGCGMPKDVQPDDWEIIASPTGERVADDPSLFTGRAGYNRPRGQDEGQRPITRYEQRRYAEQLRASPDKPLLWQEAGTALEHYMRTDRAGARPVPPALLDDWIARGILQRVVLPDGKPPEPVPCVVLDPFGGAGTTMLVADRLGRHGVGVELSGEYTRMARRRCYEDAPLLAYASETAQ